MLIYNTYFFVSLRCHNKIKVKRSFYHSLKFSSFLFMQKGYQRKVENISIFSGLCIDLGHFGSQKFTQNAHAWIFF